MKSYLLILLIIISSTELFSVDFDFIQFRYDENKTLLELNYQLESKNLDFHDTENINELSSQTEIEFKINSAGVSTIEDNWIYTYYKNRSDSNIVLFDKRIYLLFPGQYNFEFVVKYSNNKIVTKNGSFVIKDLMKKHIQMSDILLAHSLEDYKDSLQQNKLFKRNNLFVIPNVSHTITGNYPYLKYYFELYNLDTSKLHISIHQKILTGSNEVVYEFKKIKSVSSKNLIEFGLIPVDSLENGIYKLVFDIYQKNVLVTTNTTKFYILDPKRNFHKTDVFIESLSFERSPFSIMTSEKIEYEFQTMKFILSEYEIEQFELLNSLRAKQRAMFSYWKDRDTDTSTAVNEFMSEYQNRLDFVTKYFSKGDIIPGWKSERGRILLKYGFPTNREIFRKSDGKNAAEEWQYDELLGGAYFFFVDKFGDNSFQLVHSTVPKEIKNYNWYQEFNPAIDNDGSPKYNNSRLNRKNQ